MTARTVPLHKELDLGTIQAIYRQTARFFPEAELRPWFYGEGAKETEHAF